MTPTEAVPGHIIETMETIIGVLCNALTPTLIVPTTTLCIANLPHRGAYQLTLRTVADPDPGQHTNQLRKLP